MPNRKLSVCRNEMVKHMICLIFNSCVFCCHMTYVCVCVRMIFEFRYVVLGFSIYSKYERVILLSV